MTPLTVLSFQESATGTNVRVLFGYQGGASAPPVARYQIEFEAPLTVEQVDATLRDLQAKADAVDALEAHYAPKVVSVPAGLTLVN